MSWSDVMRGKLTMLMLIRAMMVVRAMMLMRAMMGIRFWIYPWRCGSFVLFRSAGFGWPIETWVSIVLRAG